MSFEHSSGAVLFKNTENGRIYLLVREKKGHIGIPKGHLEPGETETDAAKREIWEETSLKTPFIDGFRAESRYTPPLGNPKLVSYYLSCYDGCTPYLTDEVQELLELPYEAAMEALTHGASKEILQLAEDYICRNL